jgi:RNA polymerase sigma-70 factor (ECF subfamily)
MRTVGDLTLAEDAVQEASRVALEEWPVRGAPDNPGAWLVATARHKAVDALRREHRRLSKERDGAAVTFKPVEGDDPTDDRDPFGDDQLCLIFMCCHPALDPDSRMALTLRAVSGLATADIARLFLVPEPTMAQRLVRAKRKIREAKIPFRIPASHQLMSRLSDVLRVLYLTFTEGHRSVDRDGPEDLCGEAIRLSRLVHGLVPAEPEVAGLLTLLLLTDARRPARLDSVGDLTLLRDQDRGLWDHAMIIEGDALLTTALQAGRPGPYQVQAAIAGVHSTAARAEDTDWREIAGLYSQLLRYDASPIIEANRAVAVAMAEGPDAGLVILDTLGGAARLDRWPQLHIARAELLHRAGSAKAAVDAYRRALQLEPSVPEKRFILSRIDSLTS